MFIKPPVGKNILQLKDSSGGAVHTSGVYTAPNNGITSTSGNLAILDGRVNGPRTFLDLQLSSNLTTFTGYVRITANAVRILDGSNLYLGSAMYYITPANSNTITGVAPISSDTEWQSWSNGGRVGSIDTGLGSYINSNNLQPNGRFDFFQEAFAWQEKDPIHNVQFLGKFSLEYSITVEFLSRRKNEVITENTFTTISTRSSFSSSSANGIIGNVNDGKGRTAASVLLYHTPFFNRSADLYIDPVNDFMLHGDYVNETTGNQINCQRFSEILKPNSDLQKRPLSVRPWLQLTLRRTGAIGPTSAVPLTSLFTVDPSDPNNGGNPVIYHNSAFDGSNWLGRRLGFSAAGKIISTSDTNLLDAYNVEDGYNTFTGFPEFSSTGSPTNIVRNNTAAPTHPRCAHGAVRANGRPIIFISSANTFGCTIQINSAGTYANPTFNRLVTGTGTDTAGTKYSANEPSLPPELTVASSRIITAISDQTEWIYGSGLNTTNRFVYRMRFIGTPGNEWDWASWEVQILFSVPIPVEGYLGGPDTDTMTNCTANNSFWVQSVDFTNIVNGFPVLYFTHLGSISKIEHNGGVSATLSDNWTFTKLSGQSVNTASFQEGTGFGPSGGCLGSSAASNFFYAISKPIVNGYLYGSLRLSPNNFGNFWRCNLSTGELESLYEGNITTGTNITI